MQVFHTIGLPTRIHSNHSVKVIVAEKPIQVVYGKKVVSSRGFIIRSDTGHKIEPHNGLTLSIFIDAETPIGKMVNTLFRGGRVLNLDTSIARNLLTFLSGSTENHITENAIRGWIAKHLLSNATITSPNFDSRIQKVITHIKSAEDCSVKFSELLTLSGLSESRLIHLFKEEIGITMRRYALWCRTINAISAMTKGLTIKQSAMSTGFTDAAHLHRAFTAMYGLPPSSLLK